VTVPISGAQRKDVEAHFQRLKQMFAGGIPFFLVINGMRRKVRKPIIRFVLVVK
jgi:hypothetical protein